MNDHEISIHVNNNFTIRKYKVKLGAEAGQWRCF